jgi:hypothetical protein
MLSIALSLGRMDCLGDLRLNRRPEFADDADAEFSVPDEDYNSLMGSIRSTEIPVPPDDGGRLILDGCRYELTFRDEIDGTQPTVVYRWHSRVPEGWEELGLFTVRPVEYARKRVGRRARITRLFKKQ